MKKIIYILILTFIMIPGAVFASKAMDQIAINKETKQCSVFNAGDEFTRNTLPEGWESFYLSEKININNVDISSCTTIEECCKNLGFKYIKDINTKNIVTDLGQKVNNEINNDKQENSNLKDLIEKYKLQIGGILIIILGIILLINKNK